MFEKPYRTGFFAYDVPTLKFLLGYSVPTKLLNNPPEIRIRSCLRFF